MNELLLAVSWFVIGFSGGCLLVHFHLVQPARRQHEEALGLLSSAHQGWGETLRKLIEVGMTVRQYEEQFGIKSQIQINKELKDLLKNDL